jgi:hypothetical protein
VKLKMEACMISNKVEQLNIENGYPTVSMAITKMVNALTTYKKQGCKAVIIIHGYGSTGVGGSIKPAVIKQLSDKSMCGIVRDFVSGEQWYNRKREILDMCQALKDYDRMISDNDGITVALLKK